MTVEPASDELIAEIEHKAINGISLGSVSALRLYEARAQVKAAQNAMRSCEHDGGFDREVGPIGCLLLDKCVCVGVWTEMNRAAPKGDTTITALLARIRKVESERDEAIHDMQVYMAQHKKQNDHDTVIINTLTRERDDQQNEIRALYKLTETALAKLERMDAALEWLSDGPHDAEKTYAELVAEFSRRARAARKEPTDG